MEEHIKDVLYATGILGMDAGALDMEAQNINVLDGKLNANLFASGDYLIYHPYNNTVKKDYLNYGMRAGEKITLSLSGISHIGNTIQKLLRLWRL